MKKNNNMSGKEIGRTLKISKKSKTDAVCVGPGAFVPKKFQDEEDGLIYEYGTNGTSSWVARDNQGNILAIKTF